MEDLKRIAADLWPHLADAEEIKTVQGKAPKRPPLTCEAKEAIFEVKCKSGSILRELDDLTEPALKGQ